ncbi:MAG: ASKHA domain-containing protein [Bacillota bacterium]
MPKVTIEFEDRSITAQSENGDTLLSVIQAAGAPLSTPCGGNHQCGKCLVEVHGAISAPTKEELALLPEGNKRLACFTKVEGPCTIILSNEGNMAIESAYVSWQGNLEPLYQNGYGAAIDIGTTTVVGQIFCHDAKKPIAVVGERNAQLPYGADVITRIVHCNEHSVVPLQKKIKAQLSLLLRRLCGQAGIAPEEIRHIVVTGNTTMLYILFGLEPKALAYAPFIMNTPFGGTFDLGFEYFEAVPVTVPRCISAYVGADITCSVLASGIVHQNKNILLVDAGTNGEMALRTDARIVCCSTAAGPAFEGAGIACGGNAVDGAIDSVQYKDGLISCTTIGGVQAKSICGSGLIDAAAALLQSDQMDAKGRLAQPKVNLCDTDVYIDQRDIRQLQLAKGAIRAGMDTLLQECRLDYQDIDQIVLCGGFGSFLRPASAEKIGLIPPACASKSRAIGNAACNGAGQILQSREKWEESLRIAEQMHTIELSTSPAFSKNFKNAMYF